MHRIYLAFLCFFRILFGKALPQEVLPAAPAPAPAPALPPVTAAAPSAPEAEKKADRPPEKPEKSDKAEKADKARREKEKTADVTGGALLVLGLLQREGRLVDFLNESIDGYEDADIGAAVRDIHKGCKKVMVENFGVEPILDGDENDDITVDPGFDPVRIRLTGNVSGTPPFKGTLRHHGWRAAKIKLPTVADGMDASVVAPAEVELP